MKQFELRLKEIEDEYKENTWWKTDSLHHPIEFDNLNSTVERDVLFKKKKKIVINDPIHTINDLLKCIDTYPLDGEVEYSVDMEKLHAIREPLIQLNDMIGLSTLKKDVIDQILYYVQDLHKISKDGQMNDYLHTVICGSPGTGKTKVAKLLGDLFCRLSVLSRGTFFKATRDDFVAGYLGQTALKTKDLIQSTLGGVLFIDEAYALGHSNKNDSFSKEAIDVLNESLSHYRNNWMVIMAGYERDLEECLFSYNAGLKSRFTWRYTLDDYNGNELMNIFKKMANDQGWDICNLSEKWFHDKQKQYFSSNGRDMETLFTKCKIAYGRIQFGTPIEKVPIITQPILEKGFEMFCKHTTIPESSKVYSMYM